MRTISVDVNVMNQMKNTIEFFSDRLCFVDEAFQNAQRSGAKNLRVQVETDHIVVEDDGCGCDMPVFFCDDGSIYCDELVGAFVCPGGV